MPAEGLIRNEATRKSLRSRTKINLDLVILTHNGVGETIKGNEETRTEDAFLFTDWEEKKKKYGIPRKINPISGI